MPVYFSPPATSDPNDDAVLVGYWLGGSQLAELKAVSPNTARAALARLRKTNFAGVHPMLLGALTQLLANPPRRRRGRPPEPQRRAVIIQFIRERQRPGDWRQPVKSTTKAVEAAMLEFGVSRDYCYELLEADQKAGRIAAPVFAARVPIGQSPATWSPERRARAEKLARREATLPASLTPDPMLQIMSRPVAASGSGCFQLVEFTSTLSRLVAEHAQHEKGDTSEVSP
jgi:hypothetical protein